MQSIQSIRPNLNAKSSTQTGRINDNQYTYSTHIVCGIYIGSTIQKQTHARSLIAFIYRPNQRCLSSLRFDTEFDNIDGRNHASENGRNLLNMYGHIYQSK